LVIANALHPHRLGVEGISGSQLNYQPGSLLLKLADTNLLDPTAHPLLPTAAAQASVGQIYHDADGVEEHLSPGLYPRVSVKDELIGISVKPPVLQGCGLSWCSNYHGAEGS
jgi:hypothetical protein